MGLQCPFCGYIWNPRRLKPASCPRCKRYETGDKLFVDVNYDVRLNRKAPVFIEPSEEVAGAYYQCYACPVDDKHKAVVKIGTHHYCAECAVKVIRNMSDKDETT